MLTFIGVLFAQLIGRKGAKELETRSKREETMRNLRWAAELAVSNDDAKAKLGVSQLNALGDSDLLDDAQRLFIDAALAAVVEEPVEELEEDPDAEAVREAVAQGMRGIMGQPNAAPVRSDEENEPRDDGDGAG